MKNHLVITVLLCTFLVLGSTNNCPSYNGNDLLQSGKNAIMRGPLNGNPEYSYQAPVNFMVPSWGLQIAVTTSTIGDYNPLPTYGYNYYIQASRKGTSNYISYKLIMNNDLSWTSIQLSYLVNSRSDIAIGNFEASIDSWVPATSNVYNIYNKISRVLPAKTNYQVAAFISGFSTTDSQFALTINKKSYDNDNKNLTISFYCSADPAVLTLTISYIIYPQTHPLLQIVYDITPRGDAGSYQISGPVNFQPSKAIQYNEWRVNNRYLVCSGNQCPGLCTLREDCAKNNGNIWQDQCIYCAPGVVFEYGQCTRRCGANQIYLNRVCVCAKGFTRQGKDCINIVNKTCGTNQVYSQALKTCVCANTCYDNGNLNCQICPNGSVPSADGKSCICTLSSQFWDSSANLCKNRCTAAQQWQITINKCECIPTHCWYNQNCRQCPSNSQPTVDRTTCICKSANAYYLPQTNLCIQCNINGYQQVDHDKSKCQCKAGYTRNLVSGKCQLNAPQCKDYQVLNKVTNKCDCKDGQVRDGLLCRPKCAVNQIWDGKFCVCDNGYARYGPLCKLCPARSIPTVDKSQCVCTGSNQIFALNTFQCLVCPPNAKPNADKNNCNCIDGYNTNAQGICVPTVPTCVDNQILSDDKKVCNCKDGYIRDSFGKCQYRCAVNQLWVNGKCVCVNGFAYNNGVCQACPTGSIPSADQSKCVCGANQKWVVASFSCVNCQVNASPSVDQSTCVCNNGWTDYNNDGVCQAVCGPNQDWVANRCVCKPGYAYNNGVCTVCPLGAKPSDDQSKCICAVGNKWVPAQFACVQCQANASPSADQLSCVCNNGWTDYNGDGICDAVCGANQVWSVNKCVCSAGYAYNNGVCTLCPLGAQPSADLSKCICGAGQKWIQSTFSCVQCPANSSPSADQLSCICNFGYADYNGDGICEAACGTNQDWVVNKCVCKVGFALNSNNVCTLCPVGSQPSADKTKCVCGINQKWVPATFSCVQCQANSSPSVDQLSCNCNAGWTDYNNDGVCQLICGANQSWVANKCVCNAGFAYNNGVCQLCPLGSQPSADFSKCVCAGNQKWVPATFSCVQCQANASPSADQLSCVCNNGWTDYNNDGICDAVCGANQVWSVNKCVCNAGYAYNKGVCTVCPLGSKPSDDQSKCICAINNKWVPSTFSCVQCSANSSPSVDQLSCICNAGWTDYNNDGICDAVCGLGQQWVVNKCQCKAGYAFNNGVCTLCPLGSQPSVDQSRCVCAGNQKWVPTTFSCVQCQANASPISDQSICVCNNGFTDYNSDGICHTNCDINQQWVINKCTCIANFAFNSKGVCQFCPSNSVSSGDHTKCICSGNNKWVASTFSCVACPNNSSPTADQLSCQCNPGYTDYNKDGICQVSCNVNQDWKLNKCSCKTNYAYNLLGNCQLCPSDSVSSNDDKKCICNGNQRWSPSTFTCIDCPANSSPSADQSQCICNNGYSDYNKDGLCEANCGVHQIWDLNICVCEKGYIRNANKICTACPANSQVSSDLSKCICNGNYKWVFNTFTCVACQANSSPIADQSDCHCNIGYSLNAGNCVPSCTDPFVFNPVTGSCVCKDGYFLNGNLCLPNCQNGQKWNGTSCVCPDGQALYGTCKVCPVNTLPNSLKTACICTDSSYIFQPSTFSCFQCPQYSSPNSDLSNCTCNKGFTLNTVTNKCTLNCNANQNANYVLGICQCQFGYYRPQGQTKCQLRCTADNQQYNGQKCICKPGCGHANKICTVCPANSVSNFDRTSCKCLAPNFIFNPQSFKCQVCPPYSTNSQNGTQCTCLQGYQLQDKICQPICDVNQELDKVNGVCDCKYGFMRLGPMCVQRCGLNNQWTGKQCRCKQGHIKQTGVCKPCPSATSTNPSRTNCLCTDNKKIFDVQSFSCINIPSNSCPNNDFTDFVCLPGFNKGNKTCDNSCPAGAIPDNLGHCGCTGGLYLDTVKNICSKPITCPINSVWNTTSLQCVCTVNGQYMNNGQCTSCGSNSFYSIPQQQCVCNTGYFNIGGVCSVCDSRTRYNGTDCVCQLGYYGNRDKCNKCHASCSVCSGPQANQCQACSDVSMILQNGYCNKNNPCDPGFFLDQVDTKVCQKCTDNCIICDTIFQCLQCAIGYQAETFEVAGQNVTACTEICGDGIKYEQECDDGNTVSGDGCSSTCNIQAGWTCFNGSSGHKSNCNKFIPDATVLTSMGIVNLGNRVVQSVRASYLPKCLTNNQCTNCFKSITVNVVQANVPILCTVNFVPFSQYQFLIQYNFQGLYVTSKFKTVIKLNQAFRGCFNDDDFNQQLQVNVDPAFLIKVDPQLTLTLGQIDNNSNNVVGQPPKIQLSSTQSTILKVNKQA